MGSTRDDTDTGTGLRIPRPNRAVLTRLDLQAAELRSGVCGVCGGGVCGGSGSVVEWGQEQVG